GTGFYADGQGSRQMRLSYCYPEPDRIREGVRRLGAVIEQELEVRDTFGAGAGRHRPGIDTPGPDLA
ncbi:MAG: PLP-dependent aminotransferase family protein, partial [Actinomycetes bacterium]